MLLVEPQPKSNASGTQSASRFRLRFRSDATSQQIVDLREGKTTIGSSPRCDIRIQQPGVQPLHCLILCEGESLSARRWAAGTRLNGQPFDEARLAPGDCLTVGDIEFVVEVPQLGAAEIEAGSVSNCDTSAESRASSPREALDHESWAEWSSTRQTVLSAERKKDAGEVSEPADGAVADSPTGWAERLDKPQGVGQQSSSRLTGLQDQLMQLQEKMALWKEAREAWQQEKAEWRAEREQTQRLWTEFQQQLVEVQTRADEIAGRIERLEHSMAAQALVPKFAAPYVASCPTQAQADEFREAIADAEATACPANSFDIATAPVADVADEPKSEIDDELAPFAEFSIWRQGALHTESTEGQSARIDNSTEPRESPPESSAEPSATSAGNSWQAAPAKSFIEQYGHLFAEDDAGAEPSSDGPPTAAAAVSSDSDKIVRKQQNMGRVAEGDGPTATASEDEESIEQYMSRLLQRVRGDQPQVGNTPALASTSPLSFPTGMPLSTPNVGATTKPTATTGELPGAVAKGDRLTTSLGTVRRKAPIVEQPADLKTLRDLANETARRAISTHGLRIHRRKAITKVIVSLLAGMTSLWMMLDAGDWRNLQFITACVALVAAAYWAGQAFCELLETFRAATYDGPEDKLQGFANLPPSNPPVDVKS